MTHKILVTKTRRTEFIQALEMPKQTHTLSHSDAVLIAQLLRDHQRYETVVGFAPAALPARDPAASKETLVLELREAGL